MKRKTTLTIDGEVLDFCKKSGINISNTCEKLLKEYTSIDREFINSATHCLLCHQNNPIKEMFVWYPIEQTGLVNVHCPIKDFIPELKDPSIAWLFFCKDCILKIKNDQPLAQENGMSKEIRPLLKLAILEGFKTKFNGDLGFGPYDESFVTESKFHQGDIIDLIRSIKKNPLRPYLFKQGMISCPNYQDHYWDDIED